MIPTKTVEPERTYSQDELKDRIAHWIGPKRVPKKIKTVTDTSDFFRVDYDDVLMLNGRPYLARHNQKEGRFGLDDEPKFWVRHAIDLLTGESKIIKMVFHEQFSVHVGGITFHCIRSPRKEARILETVKEHPHFMHGFAVKDSAGNLIRIIDYIKGKKLHVTIPELGSSHEDYFMNHFPSVFDTFIELVKAIQFLHDRGEKHGDIRADHLIQDKDTGTYKWIDFDFNYVHRENFFGYDLFGLGNILSYVTARGEVTLQKLREEESPVLDHLSSHDMNIIFNHRVVNLKKVYPYIPASLNLVLLHFSIGSNVFYENTAQFLSDLMEVKDGLR